MNRAGNRVILRAAAAMVLLACLVWCFATAAVAVEPTIRSDKPNAVTFPAENARFVRFLIRASSGSEPCIDELEVYGEQADRNLALAKDGAKATASSCLPANAKHQIPHLNDGRYGNDFSWIAAATAGEWAQIELAEPAQVSKVVFSRDRLRQYADRVPIGFEIQLSTDGAEWKTVAKVAGRAAAVAVRRRFGGFAGVVPNPPPPPRVSRGKVVVPDEPPRDLEVPEKDELDFANLALDPEAKPAASSALTGYPIHQIAHLNDGLAGNDHSWISRQDPSWAEIDLGRAYWVYRVAFGSDSSRQFGDRGASSFAILAATEYNVASDAPTWTAVHKQAGGPPVHVRTEFKFKPVQARWLRIAIDATTSNSARIDELEIFGREEPIPLDEIGPLEQPMLVEDRSGVDEHLRYAFLGEEHAWLKTYGRADLSQRLVPYNGRVQNYPRHVDDDVLPLPPVAGQPKLDGRLDDPCWAGASRGVVRVASPYDFDRGPLAEYAVTACYREGDLLLAIRTNRLLSSHLAVVSTTGGQGCGVVAYTTEGLVFNDYASEGRGAKLEKTTPLEGAIDESLTCCEVRIPLEWFPECREQGIRIGLGMGGKHTRSHGRAVNFVFSPLAVAEVSPCIDRTFRVRLAAAPGGEPITVDGNAPGLTGGLTIAPGESKTLAIPAEPGPIGPEYKLQLSDAAGESYALNLFRYDPLGRTLDLMQAMVDRFEAKGLDVQTERSQLADLRRRQHDRLAADPAEPAAERQAFFDARLAKRRLFLREPELAPIENLLFVKRQAFRPSHNYSVNLDSAYRPGGGVYTLHVPRRDGRFEPGEGTLTRLFESGGGIARNPMANFDRSKIYFGYRPAADDYYHLMQMDPDGENLEQITSGPFHDYWPCPLPDGGIAFISTRCRSRYLCWRPQAAVLFRMEPDGSDMRPLSFANLSEWGPSVMSDGRIIWQRSEYIDKGADFSHTLWAIRADGTKPELVFGNTIIQPNGYANGREVPGTHEFCCTLISHFGDLNGPIALVDTDQGRFSAQAIRSLTPEVPWPGMWPIEECFRDAVPLATDYFLCSHAPRDRFGLYVIDRFGNREILHLDLAVGSMCPTPFRAVTPPPVLNSIVDSGMEQEDLGQFTMADVYRGIEPTVPRGTVKYIRVVEEVRAGLELMPNGEYRQDHEPFTFFYATPVDRVSGPFGWTSYVAKASWGIAPVEEDGSANFYAPAGKTLYLQALDKDFNELQRMRSVVQLQRGEKRSCIGCHEDRRHAPVIRQATALRREPSRLEVPPWGTEPFSYERAVQPVWDAKCVRCHDAGDKHRINLTATLDNDRVPASYRTLISQGWVHFLDCGYNSGGNAKREPLTFGTLQSKLWKVLDAGHHDVKLTEEELRAVKCWTDLNCPLWPDYIFRLNRPGPPQVTASR